MFVYCLRCEVVIAHTPTNRLGDDPTSIGHAQSDPGEQSPDARDGERVIAEGVTDGVLRWSLRAGGDDQVYSTMLRMHDESGVISHGGMAGPKLWNNDLLNVYSGHGDRGH